MRHESFHPNPRVHESDFRDKYLPGFINNAKGLVDSTSYNEYLEVIVNEFVRVDVIDTNGKVLFWVPALKYHAKGTDIDISSMAKKAESIKRISGQAGKRFLESQLKNITGDPDIPDEDPAQWKMIMERYGYVMGKGTIIKEDPVELSKKKTVKKVSFADEDDEQW